MPPEAVTGVTDAALPTVMVGLGTASVVESGGFTVSVAAVPTTEFAAPVALGTPVEMVLGPDVLGVTSTLNVQVPPAASVPPETESEVAPAVGEKLPQVELAFGAEATVTPLGKVTLSATPDNPDNPVPLLGLLRVKVSVLVAPTASVVGLADTAAVTAAAGGNWMVTLQAVSVKKFSLVPDLPSQKKLNAAEGEPSVERTVKSSVANRVAAAFGSLKSTMAW